MEDDALADGAGRVALLLKLHELDRARAALGWPKHPALTVDVDGSSEGKAVYLSASVVISGLSWSRTRSRSTFSESWPFLAPIAACH